MKYPVLILMVAILAGCSKDSEPLQRIPEFEYPFDSLYHGKIFVYKRRQTGEYSYIAYKRTKEAGIDYFVEETYTDKGRISGSKYRVTPNTSERVEGYMYTYPDSSSDKFTKDPERSYAKNIADGKKYRGAYFEFFVTTSTNFNGRSTIRETFKREDKIKIGDREMDVIIFDVRMTTKASHRYVPFFSTESVYTGENIYAKHVGLVKYWFESDSERFDWELVEIKNMN